MLRDDVIVILNPETLSCAAVPVSRAAEICFRPGSDPPDTLPPTGQDMLVQGATAKDSEWIPDVPEDLPQDSEWNPDVPEDLPQDSELIPDVPEDLPRTSSRSQMTANGSTMSLKTFPGQRMDPRCQVSLKTCPRTASGSQMSGVPEDLPQDSEWIPDVRCP
ncbi:unnamed protein product [Arctogadus glacialis]